MAFALFMADPIGRILRVVAGLVLIAVGILLTGGIAGWIIAALGLVALSAGAFDFCLVAPLFGEPLKGSKMRGN